jgi:hypothetical protein
MVVGFLLLMFGWVEWMGGLWPWSFIAFFGNWRDGAVDD